MLPTREPFSPVTRAGDWLAVSGQVGVVPDEGRLVEGVLAQTSQALRNLAAALGPEGATLASLVKVNVFLSDMTHYGEMNLAYVEAFDGLAMPSRTAVAVAGLPRGADVEIEAWAFAPRPGARDEP